MSTEQEEYERGQDNYNSTKDNLLGPSRSEPWKFFESNEEYEGKVDAYNAGFDNAADSHRRNG